MLYTPNLMPKKQKTAPRHVNSDISLFDGSIKIGPNPTSGVIKIEAIYFDEQGSILSVLDESGSRVFSASYDEWGCQKVELNTIGFQRGYISSGIKTGNWGMKSVKAGLCSAVSTYIGYNSIGVLSGKASLSDYLASAGVSTISNAIIPSVSIPVTSNTSVSVSPMMGLGETGLSCSLDISLGFDFENDWNTSVSACYGNQYYGGTASFSYKDWGGGYGYTRYNEQTIGEDNTLGAQSVGTISALISGVSIRFSNDILGLTQEKHDRWRTNAIEIGYRNYVIGSYINTNDGSKESGDTVDYHGKTKNIDDLENSRDKGVWTVGNVYSSPLWIGYRSGNQICRFGYSHEKVQEYTQNFVHRNIAPHPNSKIIRK